MVATWRGPCLADVDRAIDLMEALQAKLEPRGEWPPAWANNLMLAYINRGVTRADGQNLSGALADYGQAIDLMEALRAELKSAGRWAIGLRNALARAYMNRGIAQHQSGRLPEAIEDWDVAATIYLKRVEQGWLPAGADLFKAIYWVLGGCLDLADWPSVAQYLWAFMTFCQQLEALWAKQHGDVEPPWEIVGQFAGTVHALNPGQRAALLAALGENAEAVKQAFRWT